MRNATSSSTSTRGRTAAAGGRGARRSAATARPSSAKAPSSKAVSSKAKSKGGRSGRAANGSGETRQRILNVATKEFAAKGYDGARIDDIMRASNVSKNLIYHY